MSSTGTTTCEVELLRDAGVDELDRRGRRATKRPISSSGRCVAERPMRCSGRRRASRCEPLDATARDARRASSRRRRAPRRRSACRRVRSSSRACEVSSRKSDSGVVIRMSGGVAQHRRALLLRRVAGADARRASSRPEPGERPAQVALDVVVQRLQRRDVEDAQPGARRRRRAGRSRRGTRRASCPSRSAPGSACARRTRSPASPAPAPASAPRSVRSNQARVASREDVERIHNSERTVLNDGYDRAELPRPRRVLRVVQLRRDLPVQDGRRRSRAAARRTASATASSPGGSTRATSTTSTWTASLAALVVRYDDDEPGSPWSVAPARRRARRRAAARGDRAGLSRRSRRAAHVQAALGPQGAAADRRAHEPDRARPDGDGYRLGVGSSVSLRATTRGRDDEPRPRRIGYVAAPDALYFTDDDEACRLLAADPFALLVGFALDQQVTVQQAFAGPLKLKQRLGTLDPKRDRGDRSDRVEAAFREKPAIHRFPGSMATRVQDLAATVVDEYGGRRRAHLDRGAGRRRPARAHRRAARASAR